MKLPWLRGPLFDTLLLAFCWVPVYLWVVFVLGLGREAFFGEPLVGVAQREALALAVLVVLALTYVHRHYTFVLVYGDGATFRQRARAYVIAPLLMFGGLALVLSMEPVSFGSLQIRPVQIALVISGLWNVWHTVQQRYGIVRAYAGRAQGGLQTRAHSKLDRQLIWGGVLSLAVAVPWLRADSFQTHVNARRVYGVLQPYLESPAYLVVSTLVLGGYLVVALRWLRAERNADVPAWSRAPRLIFIGSTFALFAVFLIHGPIVGYLCFGAAHAIEYVAFVHHFAERRFGRDERRSLGAVLLGRPLVFAPLLIATMGFFYLVLREARDTHVYLAYYLGTSMLHFLYDGWIWKLRSPSVARPLGVA